MRVGDYKGEFQKIIDHLKQELGGLRTGRATSALVENIIVESYGQKMPLKSLASISVADPKSLVIEPWDKTILKEAEKALRVVGAGLSIVNEGNFLRASVPPMTEENRKEIVKLVHEKLEEARISIRNIREKVKEKIINAEKEKEITEDARYKLQDELDKMVSDFNAESKKMAEEKEKEIMTI